MVQIVVTQTIFLMHVCVTVNYLNNSEKSKGNMLPLFLGPHGHCPLSIVYCLPLFTYI